MNQVRVFSAGDRDKESVTADEDYLKFHQERRENSPVNKAVIKVVQLLEDCGEDLGHLGQFV